MINTTYRLRTVMKYKSLSLLVAACGMTLLTGCAASQDGQVRLGDVVNEVVKAAFTPSTQATGTTQSTAQATKLDAYVQPMLNGCDNIDIDQLIQQQRSAIAGIQRKGNPNVEGEEVVTTISLKNATAFGYPLSKIESLSGYEWGHTKIYFNTDQFVNLRPAFKLPNYDDEMFKVVRNDATGYQYGPNEYATILTFNRQERSILCEY